ncbi:MAG: hypothetical protein IPN84_16355 [Sphingomonadales bacterium]|jgi:hypothetical protein|nr:hypothetical protein [Sphingomonadales bacterium]
MSLKQSVRLACYSALEKAGFERFLKEGVDWPITDGFHCWVGLNTAVDPGQVEIVPFVGLHVVPVEKLAAQLKGKRYVRGIATFALPMGDLEGAREKRAFVFTASQSDEAISREADRLASLYASVGLSYAHSIASYGRLLPLLEMRLGMLGGYPESYACCLRLMDREGEAEAFVEDFVRQEPEYFAAFATAFLATMPD